MSQESILKYSHIEKLANPFAGTMAKFLTNAVPKFFGSIQGAAKAVGLTAQNATAVKTMAGITGAGVGAAAGAVGAPEGQRGQGAIRGALIGGGIGFGAGWGASKLPTLGNKVVADSMAAGKSLRAMNMANPAMSNKDVGNKMLDYMANMKTQVSKGTPTDVTSVPGLWQSKTNMNAKIPLGKARSAVGMEVNNAQSSTFKALGEVAGWGKAMREKGILEGTGSTLMENIRKAQTYTKEIKPDNLKNFPTGTVPGKYVFQRSAVGKVVGPLAMSGVGMGVVDAATTTNEDGTKPTVGKRLSQGTKSALKWGRAPQLMWGKALAYDIPKTFIGGNKQPQVENYY
jgi:hypothetical protein